MEGRGITGAKLDFVPDELNCGNEIIIMLVKYFGIAISRGERRENI